VSAVRYPVSAVKRASELREAGWSFRRIAALIERETGFRPAATTVQLWCSPDAYQDRLRRMRKRCDARRKALQHKPLVRTSSEWRLARMHELADRGVSARAIGQVAAVWFGEELTEHQVRRRLGLTNERSAA
jgi:hypothetical protein